VRNLGTGQVEVIAEGARADLEDLLSALREGPGGARVSHVQVSWSEPHGGLGPFTVGPSA
jgi:acylphosphatase